LIQLIENKMTSTSTDFAVIEKFLDFFEDTSRSSCMVLGPNITDSVATIPADASILLKHLEQKRGLEIRFEDYSDEAVGYCFLAILTKCEPIFPRNIVLNLWENKNDSTTFPEIVETLPKPNVSVFKKFLRVCDMILSTKHQTCQTTEFLAQRFGVALCHAMDKNAKSSQPSVVIVSLLISVRQKILLNEEYVSSYDVVDPSNFDFSDENNDDDNEDEIDDDNNCNDNSQASAYSLSMMMSNSSTAAFYSSGNGDENDDDDDNDNDDQNDSNTNTNRRIVSGGGGPKVSGSNRLARSDKHRFKFGSTTTETDAAHIVSFEVYNALLAHKKGAPYKTRASTNAALQFINQDANLRMKSQT